MDPPPPTLPVSEAIPLSEQDKIRLKRIAKLGEAVKRESTAETSTPVPVKSTPRPTAAVATVAPPPRAAFPITVRKAITIHPAGSSASGYPESFAAWEDSSLARILGVTLNREQAESSGWSTTYLKEVALEIGAATPNWTEGIPLKLSADLIDQLLLARLYLSADSMTDDLDVITVVASMPKNQTAFEYLRECWKRERAERSKVLARKGVTVADQTQRVDVLEKTRSLIISYMGLILSEPSLFPQDVVKSKPVGPAELLPLLFPGAATVPDSTFQPADLPALLSDLARRFAPSAENDFETGLEDIIGPVIEAMGRALLMSKVDIGGGGAAEDGKGWRDNLQVLLSLTSLKPVAGSLPLVPSWDTTTKPAGGRELANGVEVFSLLGPFLRLSTFPDAFPTVAESYFPAPSAMTPGDIESAASSLRGTLRGVQMNLYQIMYNIVRSGPPGREAVLALLGNIAHTNAKRAAMQVDSRTVSSHGFMINLHTILLSFAAPFIDSQYSKIDKIDPLYFKHSKRIDVAEATKMSATQQESDDFFALEATITPPEPNFISEIFFLCSAYLHIGPMHTIKEHKGISQHLSQLKRGLADMEADTTWRGTPNEAGMQAQIGSYKKKCDLYASHLQAYEVQLLDTEYLTRCVGFGNLIMAWLVRMVDPLGAHPATQIKLPLPDATPELFRMLPEYLIEDVTEFLTFVSKYSPGVLGESSQDELMTFMLVFLSTGYMKNPYLKGQFVEIMYFLTRPMQRYPRGSLGDVINFHPLALKHLIPSLIHAYVEIEVTGSHTQFYDKFNTRYYITQLFKLVWSNPTHREALKEESLNLDRYVRFINLLMNDTTFLLEESLIHLGKILDIQKQMDNTVVWEAKPAAERQETEKLLRSYEGTVRSDLDLGTESLRLLKLFTAETKGPFLAPEIVDRLAAMLDYNLNMLAGPKCQDLKVKDPEKYKFRPKELLADVLQIYLELGTSPKFHQAVAKDGRSYSKDLFERAGRFASKMSLKTDVELEVLKAMVVKVEEIIAIEEAEDAMGEVPDDFLDPLTYEIMRDPVILPSSKQVVDRSSIKQHYLSDATDPFNRAALVWEDIVDAVDLKGQIDEFLLARRANRSAAAAETVIVDEAMDAEP